MKFLALCPCERVIIDKYGVHSLINILQNVAIEPAPVPMQQNTVVPRQWSIFSMWSASREEIGKKFEQVYQIYWPDQEKFSEENFDFIADGPIQQVTLDLMGFPAGQPGDLRIVTWLFHEGHKVSDVVETSIHVTHIPRQTASAVRTSTK